MFDDVHYSGKVPSSTFSLKNRGREDGSFSEYCTPYFKFQTSSNIVYMSALEMVVGCTVAVGRVGSKYFWRVKGGTTLM